RGVQGALIADVIDVAAPPGDQAGVLDPLDRFAEVAGAHRSTSPEAPPVREAAPSSSFSSSSACSPRAISAARNTEAVMLWYPVHRHKLPPIASRASSSVGSGFSARKAVT